MLWHYQCDLFLHSHGTQSRPWSHCRSAGIPIKASTEHDCAGLTLTISYTNLFFLLLSIMFATWINNCFKISSCFLGFYFPSAGSIISLFVIPQLLLRTMNQDIFECLWCSFPFMGTTTKKPEAVGGFQPSVFNTSGITGPSWTPSPIKQIAWCCFVKKVYIKHILSCSHRCGA